MGNSIAEIDTTPSTWGGITKTVSRLVIDCASPRDQGVIHCAAVAGGKTVLSQPIMLLINGKSSRYISLRDFFYFSNLLDEIQ